MSERTKSKNSSPQKQSKEVKRAKLSKEIYTWEAPFDTYALAWSCRQEPDKAWRLAVGSFIQEYKNEIHLIQLNSLTEKFEKVGSIDHPYPATKILWRPGNEDKSKDLLATTGDYLRLWNVSADADKGVKLERGFNNNTHSEYCAPLTSMDWNPKNTNLIGTSSIDTTCTIWDLEAGKATVQLIAHDKEVYDISFADDEHIFSTVGGDASIRMFDLRSLEHSTILYEEPDKNSLIRLEWNKRNTNYMAAIRESNQGAVLIDIRKSASAVANTFGHGKSTCVNAVAFAPHSAKHVCTAGEDKNCLIWDIDQVQEPILSYAADYQVDNLSWSAAQPDWIAITYRDRMQILRV